MNRIEVYNVWKTKKVNGTSFMGDVLIKKLDRISDANWEEFVEFIDYMCETKPASVKGYRSKIIDFLTSEEMLECSIYNIYHKKMCEYLSGKRFKSKDTFESYVAYIKAFFEYFNIISVDWDRIKNDSSFYVNEEDEEINETEIYSAEQISEARELIKNDIKQRFIFEMFYLGLTRQDIQNINYECFDLIEGVLKYSGKVFVLNDNILKLVKKLDADGYFDTSQNVDYTVDKMKRVLADVGITNFKYKDVNKTREMMLFRCPQCGNLYEAVADNWCVAQYVKAGNMWLVCRERCGNG